MRMASRKVSWAERFKQNQKEVKRAEAEKMDFNIVTKKIDIYDFLFFLGAAIIPGLSLSIVSPNELKFPMQSDVMFILYCMVFSVPFILSGILVRWHSEANSIRVDAERVLKELETDSNPEHPKKESIVFDVKSLAQGALMDSYLFIGLKYFGILRGIDQVYLALWVLSGLILIWGFYDLKLAKKAVVACETKLKEKRVHLNKISENIADVEQVLKTTKKQLSAVNKELKTLKAHQINKAPHK
jgi:hypothetical protein